MGPTDSAGGSDGGSRFDERGIQNAHIKRQNDKATCKSIIACCRQHLHFYFCIVTTRFDSFLKTIKRSIPAPLFGVLAPPYHRFLAWAAAVWYRHPSRELIVIGVTGTKGKSTTVHLIGRILEAAGHRVGWSSSISLKVGERERLNPYHMTMPGRFVVQRLLREMVAAGCGYAIIEVTSEAVKQFRHRHIWFDAAVFTNLAPEHIESHGSYEAYRAAKLELFRAVAERPEKRIRGTVVPRIFVVNMDDQEGPKFLELGADITTVFRIMDAKFRSPEAPNILPLRSPIVDAVDVSAGPRGSTFRISESDVVISTPLVGIFNVSNILAATATAILQEGVTWELIKKVVAGIRGIPGRMEEVDAGQPFRVIVDFAHTPGSFRAVFQTARRTMREGEKLIAVFGATGGGRDTWKRPELGAVGAEYADHLIVTNEDPYGDDPRAIMDAIVVGVERTRPDASFEVIEDRRQAIAAALKRARTYDTVLLLGKGAERVMKVASGTVPWDDRTVAREELAKLGYRKEP